MWQTVRSFTACLSKPFRDAYKGLRKALIGSDGGEEPWRYCVSDTNNAIGFAIGAMFVREVFNGHAKPQAEQMINSVRIAFKENLKNLEWMDPETRVLANEKADAISDMIGFPDYILNPQLLDERYKTLDIDPNNYFDNNVKLNVFNLKKNLEKLDQPVNKTKWGMTPPTVNAYYTPTKNQIVFPAGILQLPFYDISNPKSLNFGGMGVVMGHEVWTRNRLKLFYSQNWWVFFSLVWFFFSWHMHSTIRAESMTNMATYTNGGTTKQSNDSKNVPIVLLNSIINTKSTENTWTESKH